MTGLSFGADGLTESYTNNVVGKDAIVAQSDDHHGYNILTEAKSERVMAYEEIIVLEDAEFVTASNGPNRIRGTVVSMDSWTRVENRVSVPVTFNADSDKGFVHRDTGESIASAELVCLHPDGVAALGVVTE